MLAGWGNGKERDKSLATRASHIKVEPVSQTRMVSRYSKEWIGTWRVEARRPPGLFGLDTSYTRSLAPAFSALLGGSGTSWSASHRQQAGVTINAVSNQCNGSWRVALIHSNGVLGSGRMSVPVTDQALCEWWQDERFIATSRSQQASVRRVGG